MTIIIILIMLYHPYKNHDIYVVTTTINQPQMGDLSRQVMDILWIDNDMIQPINIWGIWGLDTFGKIIRS